MRASTVPCRALSDCVCTRAGAYLQLKPYDVVDPEFQKRQERRAERRRQVRKLREEIALLEHLPPGEYDEFVQYVTARLPCRHA